MKVLMGLAIAVLLTACANKMKTTTPKVVSISSATDKVKEDPDSEKVIAEGNTITDAVAVIINPSRRLIAKVKKENPDEGGYDTLLDDDVHYMSASEHYLDSLKVRKIQRESEGYIAFKTAKGQIYKMKVDTMFFGILLFNRLDKPIEADIVDIQPDFEKYMLRTP